MRHEPTVLREVARELRRHQTPGEIAMWHTLRNRGFLGLKFRRQFEYGRFIIDFYCEELQLAIEMDGAPHLNLAIAEIDAQRTEWLQRQGVTVVRVENEEYLFNGTIVLERMRRIVEALRRLRQAQPPT